MAPLERSKATQDEQPVSTKSQPLEETVHLEQNKSEKDLEYQSPDHGATPAPSITSLADTGTPDTAHDSDQPDWPKGWRPWCSLFGCFLLMWNSWGLVNTYGTFASFYKQHLLRGRDLLLWNLVGSVDSFLILLLSFIVGRLVDANYSRSLIATGGILVTLGMFMLSLVNGQGGQDEGNYGLIVLTQGIIMGLGMACFFVPCSQIAATWFIKQKALAIGIVACGASVAGLVYPMMTKFLITEIGFNNAVRCVAGVIGFTALASFFLARPNPSHSFRTPPSWASLHVWLDPAAFRNPAFCWMTAATCFVFFGFYPIWFNLEEWAAHHGFGHKDVPPGLDISLPHEVRNDAIRTFWLLCIGNASSSVGRLGSAWASLRFGALTVHTATTLVGSILVLALWTQAYTLGPALAFVIVFGAVSGAIIGLPPASMAWIIQRSQEPASKLGQWTGMMYSCAAPFALTGPIIAGHLVSHYGNNYLACEIWAGVCLFIASVCMLMARLSHVPAAQIVQGIRGSVVSSRWTVSTDKTDT